MTTDLDRYPWAFCASCMTFVPKRWKVSLRKGMPSHWVIPPHAWEQRKNCKPGCGYTKTYSPQKATAERVKWQREMVACDTVMTEFVMNANNERATRAT